MRFPVLQNASQILTVWAQMIKAYERDFSALAPKTGTLTLTANATTTTLSHAALRPTTKIAFTGKTANGVTALGTLWYDTPTQGAVTLNHASNAAVDQILHFTILGT